MDTASIRQRQLTGPDRAAGGPPEKIHDALADRDLHSFDFFFREVQVVELLPILERMDPQDILIVGYRGFNDIRVGNHSFDFESVEHQSIFGRMPCLLL